MTLSKRYDAVMEKIEVTDAMRQRILANLDAVDLDAPAQSKVVRFPALKRLMPLAACLVLLLAGLFSLRHFMPGETIDPQPSEFVMVGNGIVDVADAAALSRAVGFSVREVSALPFQAGEVTYTSFWNDLAQVRYTGQDRTVTFRQSVGTEDNSGDYNIYTETVTQAIGGMEVTLKGDGETYALAVWSDGEYAYSLSAQPGLTLPEWESVIADLV